MSSAILNASEKLNGTNYYQWKFRVQLILMREKLWDHVDAKFKAPSSKSDDTADNAKWRADSQAAFATLCLTISDAQMRNVRNCKTAAEVWKRLEDIHESKSIARQMHLRRQLTNFIKLEEDS